MIDKLDIQQWKEDRTTRSVMRYLKEVFDSSTALLGCEDGQTVDRLKGRAEVLQFLERIEDHL